MWNVRSDYYLFNWFNPSLNLNGYHALDNDDEIVPFSGLDLINLGGGDDVVTLGIGGEFRPIPDMPNFQLRAAYETPLTQGDDLFGFRWTFSLIWSF
jgi:hypothetical protein